MATMVARKHLNVICTLPLLLLLNEHSLNVSDKIENLNLCLHWWYRRILGPVYDNEKEDWRILTNKGIYARVEKPTVIETIRLNRLRWFGHVQRME